MVQPLVFEREVGGDLRGCIPTAAVGAVANALPASRAACVTPKAARWMANTVTSR